MGFEPGARVHSEEILDTGTAAPDDVRESLADLRRVNGFLGGRVLRGLLNEQLRRTRLATFSLLDAGTGSGDLAEDVARRRGAFVCGLDRMTMHLREGAGGHWHPVAADLHQLPFPPRSFDFVALNLVLHHFEDDAAVDLLRAMAAIARHAVLVNDLERHRVAYWLIRHAPIVRSEVSRIDGAISVQRAFTRDDLEQLAKRAGFTQFRVRKHLPFRLSLAIEI